MDEEIDDGKKVLRVFDASKRKRTRKKHVPDDSIATDDSASGFPGAPLKASSAKASLQSLVPTADGHGDNAELGKCSTSASRSQAHLHSRSPRRHGKSVRDGVSLALKAGKANSPRSESPACNDIVPQDEDESYVYAYLVDALKKEKKKQRHSRHHERHASRDRDRDVTPKEPRPHRHKRETKEKMAKESETAKSVDPNALFETFAKLCSQFTEKTNFTDLPRTQSHKSLQCEENQRPVKLKSTRSKDNLTPKIRSMEHLSQHAYQCEPYSNRDYRSPEKYSFVYPNDDKHHYVDGRYKANHNYGNYNIDSSRSRTITKRDREDFYKEIDQRQSRSFDCDRPRHYYEKRYDQEPHDYKEYKKPSRRSHGMDRDCERYRPEDQRAPDVYPNRDMETKVHLDRSKYFDKFGHGFRNYDKEHTSRRNYESRYDRNSVPDRDDDYKERLSARERDSGLSIADNASVNSIRSNHFRTMKQEISQQREAMDKMMVLWKELMRCVKGMSQSERCSEKNANIQETAKNARDSAEEQLRLWQECMRRYETVARDVGDTDARLMEEINKQRSEMLEMSTMWQECLQRYRDMSKDFNNLKQQLAINETPSRIPAASVPILNPIEGECLQPPTTYRMPAPYAHAPQPPQPPPVPHYSHMPQIRARASVPPNWWWYGHQEHEPRHLSPGRRRSSPDSRGSRERRDRGKHRDRDRDDARYKEKSKAAPTRSEHRHKKRY